MQINPSGTIGQDNVRKYFRTVMERHELPALPFVASKVLDMIQDPDLTSGSFAVFCPTMPR